MPSGLATVARGGSLARVGGRRAVVGAVLTDRGVDEDGRDRHRTGVEEAK